MTTIERRTTPGIVELRRDDDGHQTAVGYAAVFNRYSVNLGGFVEQVERGAFAQTITQQDVVALFNHDQNQVLGRLSAGTLRLEEDDTGLRFEVDLPDTTAGRDTSVMLARKDVVGSSFGFRALDDDWSETDDGFPLRTVKVATLRDVGPVTFPAYPDSSSALANLAEKRSIPLDKLTEAAKAGELRSLIFGEEQEVDDDGRETRTVARPPILHLFA